MFQTKLVKKVKTRILRSKTFLRKSLRLWDNVEKFGAARQAIHYNIIRRMRFAGRIPKEKLQTIRIYNAYSFSAVTTDRGTRPNFTLRLYWLSSCSFRVPPYWVTNDGERRQSNLKKRGRLYEAYSESKYRFAVKKSSEVSYKMLLLYDSTFFELFFHIFAAIIEALIVAGHTF